MKHDKRDSRNDRNKEHIPHPLLYQTQCAPQERIGADHGPYHDQRRTRAVLHTVVRRSAGLGPPLGTRARTPCAGRTNQRTARPHPDASRTVLRITARPRTTPYAECRKEPLFGREQHREQLLGFFRRHNEEFGRMVGINRSKATFYKYRCVCNHLESYIRTRYGRDDLEFGELDREFLYGFHRHISGACAAARTRSGST